MIQDEQPHSTQIMTRAWSAPGSKFAVAATSLLVLLLTMAWLSHLGLKVDIWMYIFVGVFLLWLFGEFFSGIGLKDFTRLGAVILISPLVFLAGIGDLFRKLPLQRKTWPAVIVALAIAIGVAAFMASR